jgi:hypothetical protein
MSILELKELQMQVEELLKKGYIRDAGASTTNQASHRGSGE